MRDSILAKVFWGAGDSSQTNIGVVLELSVCA